MKSLRNVSLTYDSCVNLRCFSGSQPDYHFFTALPPDVRKKEPVRLRLLWEMVQRRPGPAGRLADSKSLQFLPPSNPCFFNGQCVTEMKSGTCRHSATVGHSRPRVSKCSEHASLPPCRNALCWACGSIVASWKYVGTLYF